MNKNKKMKVDRFVMARMATAISVSAMVLAAQPAGAFSFDTGNPDLAVRLDNTLKYNVGWRLEGRDDSIGDSPSYHNSDYSHDRGDIVTNRVDVFSEFDFVYKENHGFRVSAAGWKDFAYDNDVKANPLIGGSLYPNNKFNSGVRRYYDQSGEILDAFVFTRLDLGEVPVNIRAGRHNIYWGEALFTLGDGISYGQGPLDLRKATSTPGIEAKELFLPQNQISASAQLTDKVSVAANYLLEWDPHRFPDGGTYLGASGVSLLGDQNLGIPYFGDLHHGPDKTPDDRGSFGLNMQVQSDTLGGNVGVYYRKFDDRMPNLVADSSGTFLFNDYARDVKLYGLSYNRLIGAVSIGAELSRREGTALAGNARGDTWHGLVNMIAYIGQTPVFDSAPLLAELTYSKLDSVTNATKAQFEANHEDHGCTAGTKGGCVTDSAIGMNLSFTPTWYQVFPGIDMTLPLNYGMGLKGNSPAALGANENAGSWSVGVGMDIYSQYKINLAYNDYFGEGVKVTNPLAGTPGLANSVIGPFSGSETLSDRGWLSLTLKTTF